MIVYQNTKGGFIDDVRQGIIADVIENEMNNHHIPHSHEGEYRAWMNSLRFMRDVLNDNEISDLCKIAIEYQIPLTSKRVDFLISGCDEYNNNNVVVVELKQWEDSKQTDRPDVVYAYTGGSNRFVCHPSYQAYSYAKVIENFNETIQKNNIKIQSCAYLHNYKEANRSHIDNEFYKEAITLAPIFLGRDEIKLTNFIKKFIKKEDNINILMQIENGKLKPSKSLQDAISNIFKGKQEFYLIDEQKVAYEIVKSLVNKSLKLSKDVNNENGKYTIIIKGGPGTGKSIIAIQLLKDLISSGKSAVYTSKNSSPREVYFKKLIENQYKKRYLKSLFIGSGSFINAGLNEFDCIVCDEAHRLNSKSGIFKNLGENQIKEIIHASRVSVFFIDEDQIVTSSDIGSVEEIKRWANIERSKVIYDDSLNLKSQFRCNGSDGYLAFIDNLLEIRETANYDFDLDYDLKLFNSPTKLKEELKKKNTNNKARILAGYCYDWITKDKNDSDEYDIKLEDNFKAKWNFSNTSTWAIDDDSFDQVGCIHTSQGLEFDYVGVIIGKDLRYENNHVVTDPSKRARTDQSLKGLKHKANYLLIADKIIKNTYKVLLTRGQKGCYIYCEDKNLLEYISKITKIDIL